MIVTPESIWMDVETIRGTAPLVHNITNYVVMNNTANALLAIGASPVMAHATAEVREMTQMAGALVLNIGTLSDAWIQAMFMAAQSAKKADTPIVIDPVGVGATSYRTQTAKALIAATSPTIVRGNASEIMALSDKDALTKGVDSIHETEQAIQSARTLVETHQCTVCITGETDLILEPNSQHKITNGHPMMPKVTGLGCTATALCGAFAAVNPDGGQAAAHAMAVMGIAGEIAARWAKGPGSFQLHFIDALYGLSFHQIKTHYNA